MEPTRGRARPILMGSRLTAGVVVLGCLLALPACGSASRASGASGSSSTPSASASCAADSAGFAQATSVGSVDVDGDGTADAVKVTTASRECPARLIAHVSRGYVGGELPADGAAAPKVFGVRLAGHTGDLVVTQQDNPRGGYQLHVFAAGPDGLVELKDGDQPLVPFVATDTRPISATVDCRGGAIVVGQSVAQPGGTWDLRRTTYAVAGGGATRTSTKVAATGLSPTQIDTLMPVGRAIFPGCRA